jgi:hypothetical protein
MQAGKRNQMASWQDVKRELVAMSTIFEKPINEFTLAWYCGAFEDLDPSKVADALKQYSRTTKFRQLPTPMQIREMLSPQMNPDNEAREAAARIVQAVGKYGYMSGLEAKQFVGALGWRVVERMGGWAFLCENLGDGLQQGTFMAQARDLAKATLERAALGYDQIAPTISTPQTNQIKELVQGITKSLDSALSLGDKA